MKNYLPGLALVGAVTLFAKLISLTSFSQTLHLSALILAILSGFLIGNIVYRRLESQIAVGVNFAKGILLRLGIILYGFNLTMQDIQLVGVNAIVTDAIMLISTFFVTCLLGIYLLKIDKQIVYLTATGCSICGAAAILGAQSVVKADSHKVSVSIGLIVIFGSIAMFLYPTLYSLALGLTDKQFGIYIGSSIHEVAQVYSAGKMISPELADVAVISKMIRVLMLAPFLILLSFYLQRSEQGTYQFKMPWFALLFIVMALINSTGWIPADIVRFLSQISAVLLMMAMAAMGITTQLSTLKQAGFQPLLLGLMSFLWLVIGGFALNYAMQMLFY
ncbi:YeiH family protein [Mannheimia sp. AT1]|uniref:YeiH family protein n=1 Tax=Mannheimia cairinae TaxID=3025936 RepID=A0ABT5MTW7_9PAST|nr:YeiH family protein [Mannheimia cairinae]MDD0824303.1 YeiH family protein [Mannheimia cairinae]MDD0826574.1 YeiH family protein [Mannheimia cairinae]